MCLRLSVSIACLTSLAVAAAARAAERPTGFVNVCSGQSSAGFPHGFTSADKLVVGPLAMVGAGRMTDAATAREFGGNKFPVLVAAGHRVTIELTPRTRRFASLYFGTHRRTNREVTVRDGNRVVTFHSCSAKRAQSRADDDAVTFWSGFVMVSKPSCVSLQVWVDDEPAPRPAHIALGRRCAAASPTLPLWPPTTTAPRRSTTTGLTTTT